MIYALIVLVVAAIAVAIIRKRKTVLGTPGGPKRSPQKPPEQQ